MSAEIKRRIIAGLLCAAMAAAGFSCSGEPETDSDVGTEDQITSDTSEVTEADTRVYPELPDVSYDGYKFTILHWDNTFRNVDDMDAETVNGEPINDAVYARNLAVEEKYGVEIGVNYDQNYAVTLQKTVQSGDDACDAVFIWGNDVPNVYPKKLLYNLFELPYADWSKPWWNQSSVHDLTAGNKMYIVVSDMSLMDKNGTTAILFNKNLAADYNYGSIYRYVYDNEWTFDTVFTLSRGVTGDLNGDAVMDSSDQYGLLVNTASGSYTWLFGGGGHYAELNSDGYPEITFGSESTVTMIQSFFTSIYDSKVAYLSDEGIVDMFTAGQGLFMCFALTIYGTLRQMETDFGIMPIPKYTEEQGRLSLRGGPLYEGFVPRSASYRHQTPSAPGVILEALSAESRYTVQPGRIMRT